MLTLPPTGSRSGGASVLHTPAGPGTPAGAADSTADQDRRRSFDRINRVAAAVAAEKVRRRSLERQQRQAYQQQAQLQHQQQQAAAAWPHSLDTNLCPPGRRQQAPLPPLPPQQQQQQQQQPRMDLLLGRQRSASEGQIGLLLGPHTPEGAGEPETAAQRLLAVVTDWLAASEPASDSRSASAVVSVRSSEPPPRQDMAWRDELLQHVASRPDGRPHRADPLLFGDSQLQPAAPAVSAAPAAAAAAPASGAAEGPAFPAGPGPGNFTASAVRARAQPATFPLDSADGKSAASRAAWLAEPAAGAGKKKGPLAALSRLMRW